MGRGLAVAALLSLAVLGEPTAGCAQDAEPTPETEPTEPAEPDAARPPTPEEDARARELFQLGDRLYQHGQYDAAIDAFREAWRLSHRPLMLFNLANAQERAGYLAEAVASLEGYVDHAPEDERIAVANRIAALRERLRDEAHPPEPVQVPVAPEDPPPEDPRPVAPPPTPLSPGPDLVPAAVTLALGGAFLVTGVAFAAAALDARAQVDASCARTPDDRHLCPAEVEPRIADDALFSGLADGAFGLAVVGAALGVYLLADALSGGSGESEASVAVGGAVGPGSIAVALRARF